MCNVNPCNYAPKSMIWNWEWTDLRRTGNSSSLPPPDYSASRLSCRTFQAPNSPSPKPTKVLASTDRGEAPRPYRSARPTSRTSPRRTVSTSGSSGIDQAFAIGSAKVMQLLKGSTTCSSSLHSCFSRPGRLYLYFLPASSRCKSSIPVM